MPVRSDQDRRIVMTLDAGGTTLKFSAIRADELLVGPIEIPSEADHLERCLANLVRGFETVKKSLPEAPVAISFAFPGPADYPAGIVANIGNLPAFRGGVPLGPILEAKFGIPVFINNDGDLFVYGEAISGFLPYVNGLLAEAGSPKRYRNLFGLTLGTGLGGGFVRNGELFIGDNSAAGEVWLLRNKLHPEINAEEGASIRAVRRVYARAAGIPFEQAPEPRVICEIGLGRAEGNADAARQAFQALGEVAGDVLAQALTLVDGLAVIGGGISGAHPLFLQPLVDAANGVYERNGDPLQRLIPRAFNLEDAAQRNAFLTSEVRELTVPGTGRKIAWDPLPRTAVGISRLGTSRAVAIGAYAFALSRLR
ncbi:MAG TPA: ROK family protein [Bryobacteraceae bacterium]